jgi:hypothetical protein
MSQRWTKLAAPVSVVVEAVVVEAVVIAVAVVAVAAVDVDVAAVA